MALAAFDTHSFVKRLTAAGMPLEQAEVLSEEQTRLIDDRLATKDDLALLGKDLRHEIGDLRKDMDAGFAGIETKLTGLEGKFAGVEMKLTGLEGKFAGVETKLAGLESKFAGAETKLTGLEGKFAGVEMKLTGLEGKYESLRKDIMGMEQRFDAKLNKLGLQIINKLGGLIVGGVVVIAALPVISKLLHLG